MKHLAFICLLLVAAVGAQAQRYVITGAVEDRRTMNRLEFASAGAMRQADSAVVRTATTDSVGTFKLVLNEAGTYVVRFSYVGYDRAERVLTLTERNDSVDLGLISLQPQENTLGAASVTATAARVQQVGDTTQFNAAAFRVPEGSTLEALVEQFPGVEVSDDGSITWNGKTVKEFLVNGKDFFKGDTKIAMKNLPTDIVSKVKAYDKKSDYAEQTGIDDGEETTVFDLMTKRELNESWISNAVLGYGNHDRYTERLFVTRFTDHSRVTAFGSLNNTGDQGFGGPRGGGVRNGLITSRMAGADFQWDNGRKQREAGRVELGGNVRVSSNNTDLVTRTSSETFLTSGGRSSFGNSRNKTLSGSTNVNANLRFQWSPDSMTFVNLRPQFSHSSSHNGGTSQNATFSDNPYDATSGNPLDSIFESNAPAELQAIAVNSNQRQTKGNSVSNSAGASLNIVRRFGKAGRNLSLQGQYNYSKGHSSAYTISDIHYYNSATASNFINQFTWTPTKNYNYSVRLGYAEPLGHNWFAEARYEYAFRYQDSDRSLFNLDELDTNTWGNPDNHPRIGTKASEAELLSVRDDYNSQFATYRYYNNRINLGVRYNSQAIRFNAGVSLNPQRTQLEYNRPQQIDTIVTRHVFNFSPDVRFRYRLSRTNQFELRYRGQASQPSMTQLLDVVDDSDPLNISMGNPGLKPSWSNSLRAEYRGYNAERQAGMNFSYSFEQTSKSVSTRIVYDDATGVRYSRPENINGNWNMRGLAMYNFGFGPQKTFTLSTSTDASLSRQVGYVSRMGSTSFARQLLGSLAFSPLAFVEGQGVRTAAYYNDIFRTAQSQKNVVRNLQLGERLRLNYRSTYFDIGLNGTVNYQHATNSVQTGSDLDTWRFSYGLSGNVKAPWGTSLSTDLSQNSRRGYSDASMNTNELIWNVQVSHSFLAQKNLILSLQFYDILHEQSNVSRVLNAQMRRDTWSNAINSYAMLTLTYRLNVFPGGKSSSEGDQRNPWHDGRGRGQGGPSGQGTRGFGGPGGGFGGGGFGGGRPF